MTWDKETIRRLKDSERPTVRAEYDGRKHAGRIHPEGNNVWVSIYRPDGRILTAEVNGELRAVAMRVSWELLLEVLNDSRTSPIEIYPERPPVTPFSGV